MQINTDTTYQGSASKTEDVVAQSRNSATLKVTENTINATTEEKKNEKETTNGEPTVSITSNETIKKAVNEINQRTNTEAIFGFHDATNRVTIKIVDKESKEVIKECPPEETLDMIAKVWELAGILVDEKR